MKYIRVLLAEFQHLTRLTAGYGIQTAPRDGKPEANRRSLNSSHTLTLRETPTHGGHGVGAHSGAHTRTTFPSGFAAVVVSRFHGNDAGLIAGAAASRADFREGGVL